MAEKTVHEFIALLKDGKCYLRYEDSRWRKFPSSEEMRFDAVRLTSYDENWGMFESLPTTAEEKVTHRAETTGYMLKAGFDVTESTPERLSIFAFYDSEHEVEINQDIKGLYKPIINVFPSEWEQTDISINIIDLDCAPMEETKYPYKSAFPNSIKNHPVIRHKHACHIDGEDLFTVISKAVKANLPSNCRITSDYDFSLTVVVDMPIKHTEKFDRDVSGPRARSPRWKTETLRGIDKPLINICQPGNHYGQIIKRLNAANYAELEKAIDEIVQSYVDLMDERPVVCPHCHGYGWLLEEE